MYKILINKIIERTTKWFLYLLILVLAVTIVWNVVPSILDALDEGFTNSLELVARYVEDYLPLFLLVLAIFLLFGIVYYFQNVEKPWRTLRTISYYLGITIGFLVLCIGAMMLIGGGFIFLIEKIKKPEISSYWSIPIYILLFIGFAINAKRPQYSRYERRIGLILILLLFVTFIIFNR